MVKGQDYTYTTNWDNTITITGYIGPGGAVVIPDTINDLPVVSLAHNAFGEVASLTSVTMGTNLVSLEYYAFYKCYNLASVTLGNNLINIGYGVFWDCSALKSLALPQGLTSIGDWAFYHTGLTNLAIPDGVTSIPASMCYYCPQLRSVTFGADVTSIGNDAFAYCYALTNLVIGAKVTSIGSTAFQQCTSLGRIYFRGDAPGIGTDILLNSPATLYCLPGKADWVTPFGGATVVQWQPQICGTGGFGVGTNQFGFTINWASGVVTVVDVCTNLITASWSPLQTNIPDEDISYFSDTNWVNYPNRYYRVTTTQ